MEYNTLKAALFIIATIMMITTNDAIVKHITQVFGIGEIMFMRGVIACLLFAVVWSLKGQRVFDRRALQRRNFLRGLLELMATLAFLTGLSMLPLATASTLGFSSPIFLALLAALMLRERVDWTLLRWQKRRPQN